jgi:hypothetical protein
MIGVVWFKYVAPVVASILLCACDSIELLTYDECTRPCYTGPENTLGVGTCRAGTPVCDDTGHRIDCIDQVTPEPEFCGETDDKNCDGVIGTHLADEWLGTSCGIGVGICFNGHYACVAGQQVCRNAGQPRDEECNNIDDDCNGVVDDIVPALCYDGNYNDLLWPISECKAGVTICVGGRRVCAGQQLPQLEICGIARDFNCNGVAGDAASSSTVAADIVVVLDRSGSMVWIDDRVRAALVQFALQRNAPGVRYALINAPGSVINEHPELVFSWGDAQSFVRFIQLHAMLFGGAEYSWDAFVGVGNDDYGLGYREQSIRIVLWFGDEVGDSGVSPRRTEMDAARALQSAGFRFYGFVNWEFKSDFDDIAALTGGSVDRLDNVEFGLKNILIPAISWCE